MSSPNTEKITVYDDDQSEKVLNHSPEMTERDNTEDAPLTAEEAGDAALANAPWQYKLVALVTALLFPRKSTPFLYYICIL